MTDALLSLVPAWDRLTVSEGHRLVVDLLRRVEIGELVVLNDDLPQFDGATVIWVWPDDGAWRVRAARVENGRATPYLVRAGRLWVQRPDPTWHACWGSIRRIRRHRSAGAAIRVTWSSRSGISPASAG